MALTEIKAQGFKYSEMEWKDPKTRAPLMKEHKRVTMDEFLSKDDLSGSQTQISSLSCENVKKIQINKVGYSAKCSS